MQHADFHLGAVFWCGGQSWRCTDIGTRVIMAIKLDHADDPSWYNGPPYAVAEMVFDEDDMVSCGPADPDMPAGAAGDETTEPAWDSPTAAARRIAQAKALRDQAHAGGLCFDAYLPPGLADWLLAHVAAGTFRDPSEAVFVMLGEQEELEPHADLRTELRRRRIQAAIDDPRPGIPAADVAKRLAASLSTPRPAPAVWRRLA